MLKLLIADDEENICTLLDKLIAWNELGLEPVGRALNGIECFEMIEKHSPDIVITDIRMPGMTGLELVKKCISRRIRFIIISGYAQFDYAYSAIKFGVSDFLMKPINQVELNDALARVVADIAGLSPHPKSPDSPDSQERDAALSNSLLQSLYHHDFSHTDYPSLQSLNDALRLTLGEGLFLPVIVRLLDRDAAVEHVKIVLQQMKTILHRELEPLCQEFLLYERKRKLVMLLNYSAERRNDVSIALQFTYDLLSGIILPYGVYFISMGIGQTVTSLTQLQRSFIRAQYAADSYLTHGFKGIVDGSVMKTAPAPASIVAVEEPNRALALPIETLDVEQILRVMLTEFRRQMPDLKKYPYCVVAYAKRFIAVLLRDIARAHAFAGNTALIERTLCEKIVRGLTLAEMEDCLRENMEAFLRQIYDAAPDTRVIATIKSYIENNYSQRIRLEDAAHQVYLNHAYLGILFKRETGKNFSDYLADVRIEKAKDMLRDIKYNVNEVSDLVGYRDTRYFSRLFKKVVGVNPTQYRKLFGMREVK